MPARNTVKQYVENGYYHLYNRGVEKRPIFLDQQDESVFIRYLEEYLLPKDLNMLQTSLGFPQIQAWEKENILKLIRLNNFYGEIMPTAYSLMPNHFHFLVKQGSALSIDKFMQSLCTRYTMYFNKRYKRVGSLFQAVYKAALITSDEQLLHLSRYIHKQSLILGTPSSLDVYLNEKTCAWIYPKEILSYFSENYPGNSYLDFVEEKSDYLIESSLKID